MTLYIIYSIYSDNYKDFYIGSTTNLKERIRVHYYRCNTKTNSYYNNKLYSIIRNNGGFDNWVIEEIDFINCTSFKEARMYEQEWIINTNSGLNIRNAYTNDNFKLLQKQNRQEKHYYNNKELIIEKSKNYKKCLNCETFIWKTSNRCRSCYIKSK